MVLWFTFIFTPLGSNIKVKKKFIVDIDYSVNQLMQIMIVRNEVFEIKRGKCDIDTLMRLVDTDPDMGDIVKLASNGVSINLGTIE